MAQSATNGNVAADMRPTDYRGAVKRLDTIDNKTTKQQKIAKEIGEVYSAVEGICGVNKVAGKMYRALKKLEAPERLEVFRDLNGLIDAAGWPHEGGDMVDQAQGNVVPLRMPEGEGDGGEGIDEAVADLNPDEQPPAPDDDFEATAEELAQQQGRKALKEARDRAKKTSAPADPPADDSDLADEG